MLAVRCHVRSQERLPRRLRRRLTGRPLLPPAFRSMLAGEKDWVMDLPNMVMDWPPPGHGQLQLLLLV